MPWLLLLLPFAHASQPPVLWSPEPPTTEDVLWKECWRDRQGSYCNQLLQTRMSTHMARLTLKPSNRRARRRAPSRPCPTDAASFCGLSNDPRTRVLHDRDQALLARPLKGGRVELTLVAHAPDLRIVPDLEHPTSVQVLRKTRIRDDRLHALLQWDVPPPAPQSTWRAPYLHPPAGEKGNLIPDEPPLLVSTRPVLDPPFLICVEGIVRPKRLKVQQAVTWLDLSDITLKTPLMRHVPPCHAIGLLPADTPGITEGPRSAAPWGDPPAPPFRPSSTEEAQGTYDAGPLQLHATPSQDGTGFENCRVELDGNLVADDDHCRLELAEDLNGDAIPDFIWSTWSQETCFTTQTWLSDPEGTHQRVGYELRGFCVP